MALCMSSENKIEVILHISEPFGGGSFNIIKGLAYKQANSGALVYIIHGHRDLNAQDLPRHERIHLIEEPLARQISILGDVRAALAIRTHIKTIKPCYIHLHSSKAGMVGKIACLLTGEIRRCFYTPHGFAFLRRDVSNFKRQFFRFLEIISGRLGGTTIACSRSEFDHAKKTVKHKRVVLVENAIPQDELIDDSVPPQNQGFTVIGIGRLTSQKNPLAFKCIALKLRNMPIKFVWVGDGELRTEIEKPPYPDNLHITGWLSRQEVVKLLKTSDVLVMTSLWEGMPLALIEAHCSGVPGVTLNVEGCKDIIEHAKTGFLCESIDQIAARILELYHDPAQLKKISQLAKATARDRFSMERMHRDIYHEYRAVDDKAFS